MKLATRIFGIWIIICSINTTVFAQYENGVLITSEMDTGADLVLVDDGNYAALDVSATDGYDSGIDVPEPAPPVSNYLTTYFPHSAWGSIFGDNFMIDVRNGNDNLTNQVKVYRIEVDTDQISEIVDLTFTIGSSYPAGYGVVLYDVDGDVYQNVRELSAYNFTAGASERSLDLRLGDGTSPAINITYPTAGATLLSNTPYLLTWSLTDVSPIRYSKVYYSMDAGSIWTLIDSIASGGESYLWTTPDTISTQGKLRVESEDWAGNLGSETTGYTFTIAPGYLQHSFALGWHMTSIPLIPSNTSIESIYGDDVIGAYFVYDYSQSGGYGLVQNVEHGYGYWLALENASTIDINGATSVETDTISMALNWNIVGAAMANSVERDSLYFTNGVTTYDFTDAVNAGWISPAFYEYRNTTSSYSLATSLSPWYGYWLQTLLDNLQMITNPPYVGDSIDPGGIHDITDEENWSVSVVLTHDLIIDELTAFGVREDATSDYDIWYDLSIPPISPEGDYVRIVFHRPEWAAPVGDYFVTDYRAPLEAQEFVAWTGTLEASGPGEITVDFGAISELLPDDYRAVFEYEEVVVDLLESSLFTIEYEYPIEVHITVSNQALGFTETEQAVPTEFWVGDAYPNPFNPVTNLTFGLPQDEYVTLTVSDMGGRMVAELINGHRKAGYHEVTFDGSGLASGMYFYRIEAGEFTSTQKMVLMK